MDIKNIFSRRQKILRNQFPDVYQYTFMSENLRTQIVRIINKASRPEEKLGSDNSSNLFREIRNILCDEYGLFFLTNANHYNNPENDVITFVLTEKNIERVLDAIELFLEIFRNLQISFSKPMLSIDDATSIINQRFKEAGFGFRFENGQAIKLDSDYLHNETVKETIKLIHDKKFKSVNEEFLKAHEHFKKGNFSETIVEALKSFESTMKLILKSKNIKYKQEDTASILLKHLFENNFIPPYLSNYLNNLKSILESGIPTIRNKTASHGKGDKEIEITENLALFTLNITGSSINFLLKNL
ncbi:hypothetical protein EHQ47_16860 [Leptospira bourretii]|uniref:STM4504/CBY_0614 family protein n=1 Tax=Leptospira bourretii TaxID=2484962 RepID=UPI0010916C8C|nr:abortive infection family protein [Leptospira bourretii]TGL19767.1 hypothetical protein EHQ47_16860 [Leptospira bourretii]